MKLANKKALVVGLARSGLAAAAFLHSRGARVSVTDVRPRERLEGTADRLPSGVATILGHHRSEDFVGADFIVLSPGVPASLPQIFQARERGIPVIAEVELAFRFLRGDVIGVTGSNGKTTVTAMIGAAASRAGRPCRVAGNIGIPLVQAVEDSKGQELLYVVELSSFQLETVSRFRCRAALLLNLTPDHLDRYPSFDDYRRAKERIFLNQTPHDYSVLNADDPHCAPLSENLASQTVFFSRRRAVDWGAFVRSGQIVWRDAQGEVELMAVDSLRVKGTHNLENALAAVCASMALGLEAKAVSRALGEFPGVEHRLEHFASQRGIDFYNDSKATNVDAALKALTAFGDRPLTVIMGGLDKGGDFTLLRPAVQEHVRLLILIGAAAEKIESALGRAAPVRQAGNLDRAVETALGEARSGDVVLLAPACASFDQFKNYEERGQLFKQAVRQTLEKQAAEQENQAMKQ